MGWHATYVQIIYAVSYSKRRNERRQNLWITSNLSSLVMWGYPGGFLWRFAAHLYRQVLKPAVLNMKNMKYRPTEKAVGLIVYTAAQVLKFTISVPLNMRPH